MARPTKLPCRTYEKIDRQAARFDTASMHLEAHVIIYGFTLARPTPGTGWLGEEFRFPEKAWSGLENSSE